MLTPLLLGLMACADITPIEDGAKLNGVVQLKDGFTSAFVLKTQEGAILFDGGWRRGTVERKLEEQGLALSDITDLLLTHGHRDHLAVATELDDARIWGFAAEQGVLDEETDEEVRFTDTLGDGQAVRLGGVDVQAFLVEGHTAGSAVYLVNGVLILGDSALVNRDGALVPVPEKRSENPEQLVASMRALAERLEPQAESIDWLAPAHSGPYAGFDGLRDF